MTFKCIFVGSLWYQSFGFGKLKKYILFLNKQSFILIAHSLKSNDFPHYLLYSRILWSFDFSIYSDLNHSSFISFFVLCFILDYHFNPTLILCAFSESFFTIAFYRHSIIAHLDHASNIHTIFESISFQNKTHSTKATRYYDERCN